MESSVKHEVINDELPLNGKSVDANAPGTSPDELEHFMEPVTDVRCIILDFTPVNFVDSVGAKMLKSVSGIFHVLSITIHLMGFFRAPRGPVKTILYQTLIMTGFNFHL